MPEWIDATRHALQGPLAPSSDFDLNPDVTLAEGRILRPAAVLAAIVDGSDGPSLILTKRSSALKHHPGQIAFPGGKQDAGDASPEDAALREAEEEIGLPREHVDILGRLASHETVTGFDVTPIIARVTKPFDIRPEAGEVDEVFVVPMAHALNARNFVIEHRRWQGRKRSYYAVPYGPYYIWGATARILRLWSDSLPQN